MSETPVYFSRCISRLSSYNDNMNSIVKSYRFCGSSMNNVVFCTLQKNNGGLWNDSHTDSLEDDLSNDVDHFATIDEYYKHCSTPLDWGKLHGFGPQHFDSQPSSLLPTSSDNLNENKSYPCWSHGDSGSLSTENSYPQGTLEFNEWAGNAHTLSKPTDCVKKLYTCGQCNKSYMRYTSLYRHRRFECGKTPAFSCQFCPHRSKQKADLKRHILRKHSGNVLLLVFASLTDNILKYHTLTQHSPSHDENQLQEICTDIKMAMGKEMGVGCPESCRNRCRQKFNNIERLRVFTSFWTMGSKKGQREFLKQHVRSLPILGRAASSCRTRTNFYTLSVGQKRIQLTDSSGDNDESWLSHGSNESFSVSSRGLDGIIPSALWRQRNDKNRTRDRTCPYICADCGKGYLHDSSLWNHRRYECGKDPQFHCPHCAYQTNRKGSLKRHLVTVHFPGTENTDENHQVQSVSKINDF
ncbi:Longitudinals lacking protein, isoforms A/B/D/L [Frankliniella fusca]|uniref:Longitudinals lacking protein, isoforms A/B/D/L n=1 Tax=Frankliniella fusca TaxID=407009 RepID=A0AAE1H6K7_9NEOP|nr:Longitudinals lacking protein, isoforms A/B/D/L [Frankliniella fusca]